MTDKDEEKEGRKEQKQNGEEKEKKKMYTLEILDINYNDSDYEKYKKYKLNEKECHYIGDRESNSRVGIIKDINDEIKFFLSSIT